jgi:hypothetical protein
MALVLTTRLRIAVFTSIDKRMTMTVLEPTNQITGSLTTIP